MNCLVTGAASGLGLEAARMLLDVKENKVALLDIFPEIPAVFSSFQDRILYCVTDVASEESVKAAFNRNNFPLRNLRAVDNCFEIKTRFGHLNVVVNCAGISLAEPIFNKDDIFRLHSLQSFKKVLDVNVVGTFNIIRFSCPLLIASEPLDVDGSKGIIINVSSISATDGQMFQCGYSASKGAVSAMTLPLARELSSYGIRVCAIAPGVMNTPMVQCQADCKMKFLCSHMAFPKRQGAPCEFAGLVKSIIENNYLNGTNIRLDAGLRL
ncbi:hypothetical protein ACOME3_007262 [Neoechinorhynchus agilis]